MKKYVERANIKFTIVSTHIIHRYQFERLRVRLQMCQLCRATFTAVNINNPMKTPKNMEATSNPEEYPDVVILAMEQLKPFEVDQCLLKCEQKTV